MTTTQDRPTWHVECLRCGQRYEDLNREVPTCCGACGSGQIRACTKPTLSATTVTGTRTDKGIERTALVLRNEGEGGRASASVDVVMPDGTYLCRLNIFANGAARWSDVDVIVPPTHVGTFLAWGEGAPIVRTRLPGTRVLSIDLSPLSEVELAAIKEEDGT